MFLKALIRRGTTMRRIRTSALTLALLCGATLLHAQEEAKKAGKERSMTTIRLKLTSVLVDNQEKALKFYTEVLGFVKKTDMPAGGARWLTVVSPEEPDGTELLLEPMGFPPSKTYQRALFEAGIPLTAFAVSDVQATYERLLKRGVVFKTKPTKMGPTTIALLEDTCGNLIQLFQD
jgi:predicted enzyme related to lactoylglutathione lyase